VGHCLSSLLVVSLWSGATALGFGGVRTGFGGWSYFLIADCSLRSVKVVFPLFCLSKSWYRLSLYVLETLSYPLGQSLWTFTLSS